MYIMLDTGSIIILLEKFDIINQEEPGIFLIHSIYGLPTFILSRCHHHVCRDNVEVGLNHLRENYILRNQLHWAKSA